MRQEECLKYVLLCKRKLMLYDKYVKGRIGQKTFEQKLKEINQEIDDLTASLKHNKGD